MEEERRQILEMLGQGEITVGDAEQLLRALKPPKAEAGEEAESVRYDHTPPPVPPESTDHWRRFWVYPLLAGGAVLLAGALIMSLVYATAAATGWLVCGWIPMILGLLVMGLAWWSRYATWLHLRVHEGDGRRVAISLPVPLTLAAWVLRIARPFVPQLENTAVDEVILALRDSKTGDQPLVIDIDDEESGEKVQIYLG